MYLFLRLSEFGEFYFLVLDVSYLLQPPCLDPGIVSAVCCLVRGSLLLRLSRTCLSLSLCLSRPDVDCVCAPRICAFYCIMYLSSGWGPIYSLSSLSGLVRYIQALGRNLASVPPAARSGHGAPLMSISGPGPSTSTGLAPCNLALADVQSLRVRLCVRVRGWVCVCVCSCV